MIDQEIYDLMERFGRSNLSSLKLSTQDYTIELAQGSTNAPAPVTVANTAPAAEAPRQDCGPTVSAPLVGTFYSRPGPDQEPFVKVGDTVSKGQTLCLMEAMKMMSEIPAPCNLVVEALLKADGDLCSFGEPLVRYRAV